jgi:predicted SnoaL-like aldol condensation-catalyzing enzyme
VWNVLGVEILRFENGKIVEHWNNQQDVPLMSANANGAF